MTDLSHRDDSDVRTGAHFQILHDSIDVLLDEGRDAARTFSHASAAQPGVLTIESHLMTAETKTIRMLAIR